MSLGEGGGRAFQEWDEDCEHYRNENTAPQK